ncbi:hypothetical protein BROUX41_003945 [Berkeleyomyces rouxiae]
MPRSQLRICILHVSAVAVRRLKNGPITANACIACRKVKMKCVFEAGETVCKRCVRLQCECVLEKHRRGRKVGTKLNRTNGKVVTHPPASAGLTSMGTPPSSFYDPVVPSPSAAPHTEAASSFPGTHYSEYQHQPPQQPTSQLRQPLSNQQHHQPPEPPDYSTPVSAYGPATVSHTPNEPLKIDSSSECGIDGTPLTHRSTANTAFSGSRIDSTSRNSFWTKGKGFQPPDLLNEQATMGKFSLKTILSVEDEDIRPGSSSTKQYAADIGPEDAGNDPINQRILSISTAMSLFDNFMQKFNPWIAQFDPSLYTFSYVRSRSTFLLTAILAAAAKAFSPELKKPLQNLARSLHTESFVQGTKSVEVVHATLLLTYWKEPDDTRAWLITGYIIRMCMELGWHQLPFHREDDDHWEPKELEVRKERDVERLWLLLFVYDRSISLQTGKPWMIERSDFIIDSSNWYTHSLATNNDKLLCGFVNLRLFTSETLKLVHPKYLWRGPRAYNMPESEVLFESMETDLQRWRNRWYRICCTSSEYCHGFLIRFYGAHLRLSFYSIPLQPKMLTTINTQSYDRRPLWVCFVSAREMLQLLTEPELQPSLHFCQDSIHVMIAYATAFLLKACLSGGGNNIHNVLQLSVMDSLRGVSAVFKNHKASSNTGLLQAKFLDNVIRELEKKIASSSENTSTSSGQHLGPQSPQSLNKLSPYSHLPPGPSLSGSGQRPNFSNLSGEFRQQQPLSLPPPAQHHTQPPQQSNSLGWASSSQQELPQLINSPSVGKQSGPSFPISLPSKTSESPWTNDRQPLSTALPRLQPQQLPPGPHAQEQDTLMTSYSIDMSEQQQRTPRILQPQSASSQQQQQQMDYFNDDHIMNNNSIWETLIAEAGFNVETGAFMQPNTSDM